MKDKANLVYRLQGKIYELEDVAWNRETNKVIRKRSQIQDLLNELLKLKVKVSLETLINYASCFLEHEIEQLTILLAKETKDSNRNIFAALLKQYTNDLETLNNEVEDE